MGMDNLNEKVRIVRSAVGSMPSMGLIKELMDSNVEIIGIDSDPLSYGLYALNKSYLVPKGDNPNFINRIMNIINLENPHAILSGPEEEILTLSANKKQIEAKGTIVLCPDHKYVKICSDKIESYYAFKKIGIPVPKIYDMNSVKFPCIIKPRSGRGSSGVYKVTNEYEFNFYMGKVDDPIIQEYVEGEEYTIDVLADKKGNCLSVVPRLRLNTESGISVKGKTVYDQVIINYAKKLAKKLKLFGPTCIQCIKNEDELKFIEINTRFGGGAVLSLKADPMLVPNLIRIIKGEKPRPSKRFKEGLIMLRNYSEIYFSENNLSHEINLNKDDL